MRNNIVTITRIPFWTNLGKYLGVRAQWEGSNVQSLSCLKEKIISKMEGWKDNFLNQAGKEVMIKAVIQAIPSYIMSILVLPKTFCNSLSSAVAKFWWKSNNNSNGIHWKKFETLCSPKAKGGLCFKEYNKLNTALLSKQVWRLMQDPTSYWASSWVWKSLIHGRKLLKDGGRWSIGTNSSVNITDDSWLSSGNRVIVVANATARIVKDLTDSNNQWDNSLLRNNLSPSSAIDALKTPIAWNSPDEFYWPLNPSGTYTVKTGYKLLLETTNPTINQPSFQTLSLTTSGLSFGTPNPLIP